jgi:hypothetical protein
MIVLRRRHPRRQRQDIPAVAPFVPHIVHHAPDEHEAEPARLSSVERRGGVGYRGLERVERRGARV